MSAQEDDAFRRTLERHLKSLRLQGLIEIWEERQVLAGTVRSEVVGRALEHADMILVLVSPDWLDQAEDELLQQRQQSGAAQVVPILVRSVDWAGSAFALLPPLPSNGVPVALWPHQDQAFFEIVQGLRQKVQERLKAHTQRVQEDLALLDGKMESVRAPYQQEEEALEQVAEEQGELEAQSLEIEAEIQVLHQQQQAVQKRLKVLSSEAKRHTEHRGGLFEEAVRVREQQATAEQEARHLAELLERNAKSLGE